MKNIIIFLILLPCFVKAQSSTKFNTVDKFAISYGAGEDIKTIGRKVTLDMGTYHPMGDYLSFVTEDKIKFKEFETVNVWYRFTDNKLTNVALVFKNEDIYKMLPYLMAYFNGYDKKDVKSNKKYWNGNKYAIQLLDLENNKRGLFIYDKIKWPVSEQ